MRAQQPVKGGRLRLSPCVLRSIEHAVADDARRFKVSKSFVVSVALAAVYGIKEQEPMTETQHTTVLKFKLPKKKQRRRSA